MKTIVNLFIIFLMTTVISCSNDDLIIGSGSPTSEFRSVSNFSKINSEGVFDITITQGSVQSVEIIADDNIIHKVKTNVVSNELRLYLDDDNNYRDIILEVNIIVPSINSVKNSGVGNISILDVDTINNFNVLNSGTGTISIAGAAESLTLENEGSGKFNGFQFSVSTCDVEIIGSGDCEVNAINQLHVDIEGSGDIYYKGSPDIDANISGSGKIINAN
jgi:hypothetical protein